MDFALSNHCNLQCVMCNGGLSSAIRTQREGLAPLPEMYGEEFFDELREFLPHLERAQFKGGEPFLSRTTQRVWDLMIELGITCEVSVTTNATIWNDRVERYVRELGMHVIASVDAMSAETLESIRVGSNAGEVWANVDRFDAVTRETGEHMTLSFCLMPDNWFELGAFLQEVDRRDVNGNVILVNQPAAHSLFDLPLDDLAAIVAELETESVRIRGTLGRGLDEWDAHLARLRAHLASPSKLNVTVGGDASPIPVEIRSAGGDRPVDPGLLVKELAAWSRRPTIRIDIVNDQVVTVEAPDWSIPLGVGDWVGQWSRDLWSQLAPLLPSDLEFSQVGREEDVVEFFSTGDHPAGPALRAVLLPRVSVDGGHGNTVILAIRDATEPGCVK